MGKKHANTLKHLAREDAIISEAPPEDLLVRKDTHLSVPFSPGTWKRPPSSRTETSAPHVKYCEVLCLVNINRSKSNVNFAKKNLSQSGPVPLEINSFGGKKTRSLLSHKMRS